MTPRALPGESMHQAIALLEYEGYAVRLNSIFGLLLP